MPLDKTLRCVYKSSEFIIMKRVSKDDQMPVYWWVNVTVLGGWWKSPHAEPSLALAILPAM